MTKPSKPTKLTPTTRLKVALFEHGFKRDSDGHYSKQLPYRGDSFTYVFTTNGRVQITQRCWSIKDGWSEQTVGVREALALQEGWGS